MLLMLLLASSPLQVLKNGSGELQTLVAKADANADQVAAKADGFIDFGELAKRALGPQWEKLSAKQQTELSSTVPFAGERVTVEYKLYKARDGKWRVYDVVTDGASLVDAYADQFRSVIAKKGYDGLIETLKKRQAQLASAPKK